MRRPGARRQFLSRRRLAQPSTANARQWLERMIQATQTLNYEGTFVYRFQGPHIEAMHIVHSGGNDHERQRLISLSGPLREVVVANNSVICLSPERQATVCRQRLPRSPFPGVDPSELGQLESHYGYLPCWARIGSPGWIPR